MKVIRKNSFIYFIDFSKEQLQQVRQALEVPYTIYLRKHGKLVKEPVKKNFVFDIRSKTPFTYFGFESYIREHVDFDFITEDVTNYILSPEQISKIDVSSFSGFKLFQYQQAAIKACLVRQYGNVISPTGSGKTFMELKLLEVINKPAIIVVPTIQLAEQHLLTCKEAGLLKEDIVLLNSSMKHIKKVNIVVSNTLNNMVNRKSEMLKEVRVILYDECHHRESATWLNINKFFDKHVNYNIGFTGSLYRYEDASQKESLEDWVTFGLTGKTPIYNVSYNFLIKNKRLSKPYIFMQELNSYNVKPKGRANDWAKLKKAYIEQNKDRNNKIAEWIKFCYDNNKSVLVLSDRIEHIKNIINCTEEDMKYDSFFLTGSSMGYKYEYGRLSKRVIDYSEIKQKMYDREIKILYATSVLDEGTDISNIEFLILAYGGKSRIKVLQRIGRVLRTDINKDKVYIVDFDDTANYFFHKHAGIRLEVYKESGFTITRDIDSFKKLVIST